MPELAFFIVDRLSTRSSVHRFTVILYIKVEQEILAGGSNFSGGPTVRGRQAAVKEISGEAASNIVSTAFKHFARMNWRQQIVCALKQHPQTRRWSEKARLT
jgi:hypothetical protein